MASALNYDMLSDQELSRLLATGDHDAFGQIYQRYNALLYMHASKKLQSREQAQDVVQEVFMMLWAKHAELVIASNLAGFLYTCVHRKVLDLFTHQKIDAGHINSLKTFLESSSNTTDHLIREKQLSAIIEKEIMALPVKMREVFVLSRFGKFSHKEIATQLDISEETVKSQIKNAIRTLRVKIGLFGFLLFLIRF